MTYVWGNLNLLSYIRQLSDSSIMLGMSPSTPGSYPKLVDRSFWTKCILRDPMQQLSCARLSQSEQSHWTRFLLKTRRKLLLTTTAPNTLQLLWLAVVLLTPYELPITFRDAFWVEESYVKTPASRSASRDFSFRITGDCSTESRAKVTGICFVAPSYRRAPSVRLFKSALTTLLGALWFSVTVKNVWPCLALAFQNHAVLLSWCLRRRVWKED